MRGSNENVPSDYEVKFAEFIRMCAEAKQRGADRVIVATASALGDNYPEVIESLRRLARAELALHIASDK